MVGKRKEQGIEWNHSFFPTCINAMSALHQITTFNLQKITHNNAQIEPVHHSLQSENALKSVETFIADAVTLHVSEEERITGTGQKYCEVLIG